MKKYNHLALTVVLMVMGVLLVVGSVLASIGTTLFPFDTFVGTRAPVAGVAFGAGIILAANRPENNLTWVRAALVYCVLDVLYEIVYGLFIGSARPIPLVLAIIFGALIIWLYPRRGELVPQNNFGSVAHSSSATGAPGAHAAGMK